MAQIRQHALATTFPKVHQSAGLVEWHKSDNTHLLQHFRRFISLPGSSNGTNQTTRTNYNISEGSSVCQARRMAQIRQHAHTTTFPKVHQSAGIVEWHKSDNTHKLQHFRRFISLLGSSNGTNQTTRTNYNISEGSSVCRARRMAQIRQHALYNISEGSSVCWARRMAQIRQHALATTFPKVHQSAGLVEWHKSDNTHSYNISEGSSVCLGSSNGTNQTTRTSYNISEGSSVCWARRMAQIRQHAQATTFPKVHQSARARRMAQIRQHALSTTFPKVHQSARARRMAQIRQHAQATTFPKVHQSAGLVEWHKSDNTHSYNISEGSSVCQDRRMAQIRQHALLQHFRRFISLPGLVEWHKSDNTHKLQHFRRFISLPGSSNGTNQTTRTTTTFPKVHQSAGLVEWHKSDNTHKLQHFRRFISLLGSSNGTNQTTRTSYNISEGSSVCQARRMAQIRQHAHLQHFRRFISLPGLVEWHKSDNTHSLQHFRRFISLWARRMAQIRQHAQSTTFPKVHQSAGIVEWHKSDNTHILQHFRRFISLLGSSNGTNQTTRTNYNISEGSSVCWARRMAQIRQHALATTFPKVHQSAGLVEWHKSDNTHILQHFRRFISLLGSSNGTNQTTRTSTTFPKVCQSAGLVEWHKSDNTHILQHFRRFISWLGSNGTNQTTRTSYNISEGSSVHWAAQMSQMRYHAHTTTSPDLHQPAGFTCNKKFTYQLQHRVSSSV
jgi:expansin (peptidoglycan-binding protein)